MPSLRTLGAKTASRGRRWLLGLLLRLPGGSGDDPTALIARFPDEAKMPLRRIGLDPVPELAALRERAPVSRLKLPFGLRGWLVTGYEESRRVLATDPQIFSNDFSHMVGKVGIAADQDPGGLGFADPPAHTRLRHMLTPHFTARALARQEPRIREIVADALAEVAAVADRDGVVDLQEHFALPIPSRVIMELLGIEGTDQAEFQRLSTARFDFTEGAGTLDYIQEAIGLLRDVVARQRRDPGPGLIGAILSEYGDSVGDVELAGLADGVLTGGLETTVSMLALGSVVLLRDAELAARVRDDDAAVEPFVEEALRLLSVVQAGFPRFARQDLTLGGKEIFAGDVVVCSLSGANRDARSGPQMNTVLLDRPPIPHLAFGHGLHRCVGAELARLELRLAYPALLRRFPDLRLAVDPDDLPYRDLSMVHGVQALPVRVDRPLGTVGS